MTTKPIKAWERSPSQLNSTLNPADLITPSTNVETPITPLTKNTPSLVPVVKMNSSPNQIANVGLENINENKVSITSPTTPQSTINTSMTNQNTVQNTLANPYSSYSSPYGGGYGSGLYGGYGGSYGGYGGSYGMGYGMGGMGGMGMGMYSQYGRMNNPNGGDFLDKCFMAVERMNYQMYHFCEMTRMIQAQSTSLVYFLEIMTKAYNWVKMFIQTKSKSIYDSTKLSIITKCTKMKQIIKEFLSRETIEDDKLRKQIKILDYILGVLITMAVAGLIFKKVYS